MEPCSVPTPLSIFCGAHTGPGAGSRLYSLSEAQPRSQNTIFLRLSLGFAPCCSSVYFHSYCWKMLCTKNLRGPQAIGPPLRAISQTNEPAVEESFCLAGAQLWLLSKDIDPPSCELRGDPLSSDTLWFTPVQCGRKSFSGLF